MVSWQGWTQNIHDALLILVAFSSGINAIATGALIDMHTMKTKATTKLSLMRALEMPNGKNSYSFHTHTQSI
jgi:hypothetical protein